MTDPRHMAEQILGAIDWQTEVSGFCRCPGEAFHTSGNGKKDCRVNVDGAPTIFCFHASCAPAARLRSDVPDFASARNFFSRSSLGRRNVRFIHDRLAASTVPL